jgi:hypothetical protein
MATFGIAFYLYNLSTDHKYFFLLFRCSVLCTVCAASPRPPPTFGFSSVGVSLGESPPPAYTPSLSPGKFIRLIYILDFWFSDWQQKTSEIPVATVLTRITKTNYISPFFATFSFVIHRD